MSNLYQIDSKIYGLLTLPESEIVDEEVIEAVCNIVYGKKSDEAYEVLSEMYQNGMFDLDKARNKYEDEITDYFVENGKAE